MSNNSYYVDPDITVAETLPSSFYRDTEVFERLKSIFLNSIFNLATLLPGLAVLVRRLHDINRSGWWACRREYSSSE